METQPTTEAPSKLWYVGHVLFWVITGLVCYVLWKDKNPVVARRHLIHSIWIGMVLPVAAFGASLLLGIEI